MKHTFDSDLLFASSRMCEKIHLYTDFSDRAFLRTGSIWNFINDKSDFIWKFRFLAAKYYEREKGSFGHRYPRLKFSDLMLRYYDQCLVLEQITCSNHMHI